MGLFIGAVTVAFFGLVLWIAGIAFKKTGNYFEENKRLGKAVVVGYDRAEQSTWYSLLVRIPALNDGTTYACSGGGINPGDYPVGTVVDVLYAPKKTMGISIVEVHLLDNPPSDTARVGRGIRKVAAALLVIAGVLAIVGITTIL